MKYIIYKTTNTVDGKYYVGVHNGTKPKYLGSGKALLNAIQVHGRENFQREILEEFDTEQDAYKREAEIVTEAFVADRMTYNLGTGGKGGPGVAKSSEHREKLRQAGHHAWQKNPKASGRKPAVDKQDLIDTVESLGYDKACEIYGVTKMALRHRYYRAVRSTR
jgi:hypothetical protein